MPPQLHDQVKKLQKHKFTGQEDGSEYEATDFGGFAQYFANKQVKLLNQAQEAAAADENAVQTDIFKDCVVYITGYTEPPAQELKRLITTNGGLMCNYLAGKSYATHIVATNLTARKKIEYAKYKVVRPEWVVNSVKAGNRLPWDNFRVVTEEAGQKVITATSRPPQEPQEPQQPQGLHKINCLDPKFIQRYYESSRLHHLSVWKAELKRKFQIRAQQSNSQNSQKSQSKERLVMHVDFDSFFVAVSLLKHPHLKDKPVCVSNSKSEAGTGDVASCNYIARQSGVKNGMWLSHAKKLCPEIQTIDYDFEGYERASSALYECLLSINPDLLYPVSVDEALLDVTSCVDAANRQAVLEFAEKLRAQINEKSLVDASVGVGSNVLLAKMALRKAKPRGQYYITDAEKELDDVEIAQLPGIGRSIARKFNEKGIHSVSEIRELEISQIQKIIGGTKIATKLYEYARGIDHTDISTIPPPRSVGVEIAWGVRLENDSQVAQFTGNLCQELGRRMQVQDLKGCQLIAKLYRRRADAPINPPKYLGHGLCDITSKTSSVFGMTNEADEFKAYAVDLIKQFGCPPEDVRGIGLQMVKLDGSEPQQTDNAVKKNKRIEFAPLPDTSPSKRRKLEPSQQFADNSVSAKTVSRPRYLSPSPAPQPAVVIQPPSDVDPEVWAQLPDDIKREVAQAARLNRNTPEPSPVPPQRSIPTKLRFYEPVSFSWDDSTDASTIRLHVVDWIKKTEWPHYDDLCTVENYIRDTSLYDADWGKVVSLLRVMKHTVNVHKVGTTMNSEWTNIIDEMINVAKRALEARGICISNI